MKFLIFLGSVRDSTPPKPARLGLRVSSACLECLTHRYGEHEFELIDALNYPLEPIFKPHFSYPQNQVPTALDELANKIKSSDGFIMISPEYNHSISPALTNLLNHFGSSLFSYKPSTIVTYSAGQWGGMRAAVGMRTFLSELGCLPVSAMIHVPKAQQVFTDNGAMQAKEDQTAWFDYFARAFNQMIWWAQAASEHKKEVDPHQIVSNFKTAPSERDAP